MAWDERERAALLALARIKPDGLTTPALVAEVIEAGSALAVWQQHQPMQLAVDVAGADDLAVAADQLASWRTAGLTFTMLLDDDYPRQLREIHEAPPLLFYRGELRPRDRAVSVVGSRDASAAGLADAAATARALVDVGITVVAGLALGVDTAAHTATLQAGGRTVAVIGTGIMRVYPTANRELQDQISTEGLVLSQFIPPEASATRQTFPIRNVTISGYGSASIIVEAGENSGTRGQARRALQHGRPVILWNRVVTATNWGKQMSREPGVIVVGSVDEAVTAAVAATQPLDQLLQAAFSA